MSRFGVCSSCETPLLQPRGFHGSHLCGPCCTGEADTIGHVSILCTEYGCAHALEVPDDPVWERNRWMATCARHSETNRIAKARR